MFKLKAIIFKEYWQNPEKTQQSFTRDGFFKTGDLGRLDENDNLTLVGRESDLIISGGVNIYPKEVELVLNTLNGVKESAVVGVPDDDFGEKVVAYIVFDSNQNMSVKQIKEHCKSFLTGYKIPKLFFNILELPRNTMGKILKTQLKQTYHELTELS